MGRFNQVPLVIVSRTVAWTAESKMAGCTQFLQTSQFMALLLCPTLTYGP